MPRWLGIWILFGAFLAPAAQLADKLGVEGVRQFNAAYQAWDGSQFAAAAELFRQATTNAPRSSTNFYWLGTAQFHHMLQIQYQPAARSNTLAANAAMEAAITALEQAVKLNARDAESHALLGTLYGMKIDGNLIRMARFGPRVADHCKKALESGATNPRVQYLLGTCQFHTAKKAAAWREALATFLKAEELYVIEVKTPAGPLEPRWGYDTCLTFIGRTCEQLGERNRAADYYRKALAARPGDRLASEGLARVEKGHQN
jgi:tetratricopeptide (TPR) repeat protein